MLPMEEGNDVMMKLYWSPRSRSFSALWLMEETGQPYRTEVLDYATTMKAPAYLSINPMGKVPALRHGDAVVTETAAICAYLADAFPKAGLSVPIGDRRRGVYLKWLFFGPSVIEPAMTDRAFPRKESPRAASVGWRDFDTVLQIVSNALAKGPYLMGEQFTAADIVIGSGLRYGMMFKLIPERQEFQEYVGRITARPAAQRAQAKDKELSSAAA